MKLKRSVAFAAAFSASTIMATAAFAQTEVQWWHAMGGALGEKLNKIADDFNATQSDYKITPVYKGNYTETLTAAIAAFRARENPAIVQVFEVGTATMMAAEGAIYPVYELMADAGEPFDPADYLASVTGYYTDTEGNMLSMPFNSSTPVLYYNKDIFKKAGLDPNSPPTTWPALAETAKTIIDSGAATCGFTTGWQSWVQLENFSALHNVSFATKANGFGGFDTELAFNSPLHVTHIQSLADWKKDGLFKYAGRRSDSAPLFYSSECAMYMNSSAAYAGVNANAKDFEFGVGMLPYWPKEEDAQLIAIQEELQSHISAIADDITSRLPSAEEYLTLAGEIRGLRAAMASVQSAQGVPQNSIIGGATLWVLQGRPEDEYKGVAKFFSYLASPEVQAWWHQQTGYLPITLAAFELSEKQGFYDENPGTDTSIKQMTLNPPTENSKGLRLGNFVQIRDVINEELETVWSGEKTAKEALDRAVARGNDLLREFEAAN